MRIVSVSGSDLFRVALAELGDATQWIRIAQLNGLSDPVISGVVTLRIPAADPSAGGGIAAQ